LQKKIDVSPPVTVIHILISKHSMQCTFFLDLSCKRTVLQIVCKRHSCWCYRQAEVCHSVTVFILSQSFLKVPLVVLNDMWRWLYLE
jgi:hypothetical protein